MSTVSRKQREIRDREAKILDVAQRMLLEHSYHCLSMDRIAEELEYSKGTIYQHFTCKEDVLVALAIRAMQPRLALFRRAATYKGRTRERIQGIGVACALFMRLHPDYFAVEKVLRLASVREKTSPERLKDQEILEQNCIGTVGGVVRDAVAAGDLELPPDRTPEEVVFCLWAINFGASTLISDGECPKGLGIKDPTAALRWHSMRLLDGMGWKPLSSEYDVDELDARLIKELFANEARRLAELGA